MSIDEYDLEVYVERIKDVFSVSTSTSVMFEMDSWYFGHTRKYKTRYRIYVEDQVSKNFNSLKEVDKWLARKASLLKKFTKGAHHARS